MPPRAGAGDKENLQPAECDNNGAVPLFPLSNAWEVQASPGDSSGFGDCCCEVLAGPLLPAPAAKGLPVHP